MSAQDQIDLLIGRRSIRAFDSRPIEEDLLTKIFNATRYCFSAVNRQPWNFYVIRNEELIKKVAAECTTGPFAGGAPVLVAIVGDTKTSPKWYLHDTCFVSLQLALAAWVYGIGTCWIGNMKRDNIKRLLNLQEKDDLLTVLPLGYPKGEVPDAPPRKELTEIVHYLD